MKLNGKKVAVSICGAYGIHKKTIEQMEKIVESGAEIFPIVSENFERLSEEFGTIESIRNTIHNITGKHYVSTIREAEKFGPQSLADIMIISPCTGNTLGKLAGGITDTAVLMAAKAHLRNNKSLCIAIATNDALGLNLENIGRLLNAKNIFFVPFGQDNYMVKTKSMVSDFTLIIPTLEEALENTQLQPVLLRN